MVRHIQEFAFTDGGWVAGRTENVVDQNATDFHTGPVRSVFQCSDNTVPAA